RKFSRSRVHSAVSQQICQGTFTISRNGCSALGLGQKTCRHYDPVTQRVSGNFHGQRRIGFLEESGASAGLSAYRSVQTLSFLFCPAWRSEISRRISQSNQATQTHFESRAKV